MPLRSGFKEYFCLPPVLVPVVKHGSWSLERGSPFSELLDR